MSVKFWELPNHQVRRNRLLPGHLLHEECSAEPPAGVAQIARPLLLHLAGIAAALAAADHPVRRVAIEDDRPKHRLEAGEGEERTTPFGHVAQLHPVAVVFLLVGESRTDCGVLW